jgi:predicted RNase H-like HicB family nuclease
MRRYLILIERGADGRYGASVPDLPGCAVCGYDTPEQVRESIAAAIDMHIQGMIEDGEPIPEPATEAAYVKASTA